MLIFDMVILFHDCDLLPEGGGEVMPDASVSVRLYSSRKYHRYQVASLYDYHAYKYSLIPRPCSLIPRPCSLVPRGEAWE